MGTALSGPVLVTGASGFIGGRLVRRLVERGARVVCVVRAGSRVDELRGAGVVCLIGDVTDPGSIERAVAESGAVTVFHVAGLVKALGPDGFTRVNVGGATHVAAACAGRASPPVLVVVSSLAAAGPSAAGAMRGEEDVPAPVSRYGRSKLGGELGAARYAGLVPISIVRPPVVFGPGDRGVLEMFRLIARCGVHCVPGWRGGGHRLSLVHVDDVVEGLLLAAEKGERVREGGSPGQGVYFVAGDDHPTYEQLGEAIAASLGRKRPLMVRVPGVVLRGAGLAGDVVGAVGGRAGWISSDKVREALAGPWVCSSEKARVQLGWRANPGAVTLAEQLRATADWYRQAGWL